MPGEVAALLRPIRTQWTTVPDDTNIVNIPLMNLHVPFLFCFVITQVTRVPHDSYVMFEYFMHFETAFRLCVMTAYCTDVFRLRFLHNFMDINQMVDHPCGISGTEIAVLALDASLRYFDHSHYFKANIPLRKETLFGLCAKGVVGVRYVTYFCNVLLYPAQAQRVSTTSNARPGDLSWSTNSSWHFHGTFLQTNNNITFRLSLSSIPGTVCI